MVIWLGIDHVALSARARRVRLQRRTLTLRCVFRERRRPINSKPARTELADTIRHLCALLEVPAPTLDGFRQRLAADHPLSISQLSRYRNGKIVPSKGFLWTLHHAAAHDSGSVGIDLGELLQLQTAAHAEATQETRQAAALDEAAKSSAGHNFARDRQRSMGAPLSPQSVPTRTKKHIAADTVIKILRRDRPEDTLTLIGEFPELLGPFGCAACIVEFRQRDEHALAEALIQAFGRARPHSDVLRFALALNRCGLIPDSNKAMCAALRGTSTRETIDQAAKVHPA
jgi:transcriptional regulator with XRE-family HTH domain